MQQSAFFTVRQDLSPCEVKDVLTGGLISPLAEDDK